MAALIESAAVFSARAKSMGITEPVLNAMIGKGWNTMATFAFSCHYIPGVGTDDSFKTEILAALLGPDGDPRRTMAPGLRRLFFEAYTLVAAELRTKVEKGTDDVPRKLPLPERLARRTKIVNDLRGLRLDGVLEPSNALVDAVVTMVEDNVVKYIDWAECTSREQELAAAKKDKSWKTGQDGVVCETNEGPAVRADTSVRTSG